MDDGLKYLENSRKRAIEAAIKKYLEQHGYQVKAPTKNCKNLKKER